MINLGIDLMMILYHAIQYLGIFPISLLYIYKVSNIIIQAITLIKPQYFTIFHQNSKEEIRATQFMRICGRRDVGS